MKKSSIIFTLLTLTLAALPALGELTYLKKNTPYIEKVPIGKVSSMVSNSHAPVSNLIDENNNTEWISWQENVIWTQDYNSDLYVPPGFESPTVANGVLALSAIPAADRHWRQYRLFQNLPAMSQNGSYRLKLRYRGSIASNGTNNQIRLFLGQYGTPETDYGSIVNLDVPTEWVEKEIEFTLPADIAAGGFCCVQPGTYPGILEVDWAELSYLSSDATPTYDFDYDTTPQPTGTHSEYLSLADGILTASDNGTGWYQFPITPTFKLKPNTTYSVTINITGQQNQSAVTWWVGSSDLGTTYANGSTLKYTTEFEDQTFTFTTPNVTQLDENGNISKDIVLKLQPAANDNHDDIQIKSVKIYEYTTEINNGTPLFDGGDTENPKYSKAEDGIIYSYPLAARRRVTAAVGTDGALKWQQDQNYVVLYNLNYSVDGTVQTELHTTAGGVAGVSSESKITAGRTQAIRSAIISSLSAGTEGAVVLDFGYNVGSIEVSNLRVLDNNDTNITPQGQTNGNTQYQNREINSPTTQYMTTQQIQVMDGLKFEAGAKYTVTVRMKATQAGRLCLKLGDYTYGSEYRTLSYKNFEKSPDKWQEVKFENVEAPGNVSDQNPGLLVLQLQTQNGQTDNSTNGADNYDGEVTIQVVKISSSNWVDGKEICSINYTKDAYPSDTFTNSSDYPKIENGKLVVDEYQEGEKFIVATGLGTIDQARTYKLYLTSEGSTTTSLRSLLGVDNANAVLDAITVNNHESETEAVYNSTGQYFTIAHNSVLQLQTRGTTGRIEIAGLRVIQNANESVVWFTDGSGAAKGLNSNGNTYVNYEITNGGLVLRPQFNPVTIVDEIPLTWGKRYTTTFDITAQAGSYLLTLGEGDYTLSKEITISKDDAGKKVTVNEDFGTVPEGTGKLAITPLQYSGNIQINNGSVTPYSPAYEAGSIIGTDFFTVELKTGFTIQKDGKYIFSINYASNGSTPIDCTPTKFLIKGSSDGYNYQNLGTYEASELSNGTAQFSTADMPLKNISDGMRYLRFYCLDNVGDDNTTAICFPTENDYENKTNAYVGNVMRLTGISIYRLGEITDPAGTESDTWALPLLSRFQIEANGIKYAYPGARLRDMIGIHKSYSNTSDLFGLELQYLTDGYWDTTLPYNIQTATRYIVKRNDDGTIEYGDTPIAEASRPTSEGGQNRNYEADGIDHKESPYDCIDLLLPDLKGLRAKSDQVYVSMTQANGTIGDTYPSFRTYDTTAEPRFLNKANGFPTEIAYQGFKYKADGSKEMQGDPIVMNLVTFPESTVVNNNTINYNVANFALNIGEGWDGVRIWCRENVGDLERVHGEKSCGMVYDDKKWHNVYKEHISKCTVEPGTRMMRFATIQAYVEIPKINLEPKDGVEPYPYHLLYNSREDFKNYTWKHTQGIVDDINNDGYMKKGGGGQTWQNVIDDNRADLEKHNIALPDFNFYPSAFDDPDITVSASDGYTATGQRQRTYTILHEVQVLPGERVDLYPQSDIWKTYEDIVNQKFGNGTGINYEEQFVRWYDYLTDGAPDYLYFFSEPKSVIRTENYGFIGGKTLLDHEQRGMGTVASVYFRESEKLAFDANPDPNSRYYYQDQNGNTRLKDQWVAADFSLTFNTKLAERLGKDSNWTTNSNVMQEPIITFRHLFHLTSGKITADQNMADAKGNRDFYTNNRRYVTAIGKRDFMIRLEQDMPELATTKSSYYYKDATDNEYKRVRGYQIRTYDVSRMGTLNEKADEFNYEYDGAKITSSDLKGSETFKPIERSKFDHISSDIRTDVATAKWLRNGLNFYRAIGCDAADATPGSYLVRIYGNDIYGNVITLPAADGGEGEPLVIAEYYVTFLDPDKKEASFETEEALKADDDYYTHREEYLESHFNKDGTSSLVVNFDNYTYLKDAKYANYEFFGTTEANVGTGEKDEDGKELTKTQTGSYLKLPIAWDDSNYGFGYTTRGDYNMFVLGDHSVITPYKNAAQAADNYTGTYDRLYYNSAGKQTGLFYYVNAASDPGEMAKIEFGELCPGSTIYVSAWVNEFNNGQPETANVIFNFYANVHKKGSTKTIRQEQIHGFVTGYVNRGTGGYTDGDQGKWMHVYYTFVPNLNHVQLSDDETVDSYTLVLENNCISSSGADYAIDDIRAYVVEPRVEAHQSTPLCNRHEPNDIDVEVMIPFASLYESMKDLVTDGKMQLQYSVMDKKVFDDYLKNHPDEDDKYVNAFAASVLHYAHENIEMSEGTPTDKPLSWGTIEFYSEFEKNLDSDLNSHGEVIDGEQMLIFNTRLYSEGANRYNGDFDKDHKEYYILIGNLGTTGVFDDVDDPTKPESGYNADIYPMTLTDGKFTKSEKWADYDKALGSQYQIGGNCARLSEFKLKGASQIIVDGVVYNDIDNITCCENQRPVVQIDLYKKNEDGTIDKDTPEADNVLRANPYIDWYYGSYEDFINEEMPATEMSLWQVLTIFRDSYPDAATCDVEPTDKFTAEMKAYLKTLCEPYEEEVTNYNGTRTKTVIRPAKLQLHTSSFVFPTLTMKDDFGEPLKDGNGLILANLDVYVTAIPDDNIIKEDDDFGVICTEPTEIKITISNTSPQMLNGFASAIDYPEEMNVVPLRLGLAHLDNTSIAGPHWEEPANTNDKNNININITDYAGKQTLVIPMRKLAIATTGVKFFKSLEGDPYCYLAETNDPTYRRLGQVMYARPLAADDDAAGNYDSEFGLVPRGVVTIDANAADNAHFSNVKVTFNNTDMIFREGFYYTFKFPYEEDYSAEGFTWPEGVDEDSKPCHGETYFTIKVVPEYQKWTGDASLNWNNDENWQRVEAADVLADENTPGGNLTSKTMWKNRHTVDGSNANTFAYAPLDFTKVIIPAGTSYPQLAARMHDRVRTDGSIALQNGHGNAAVSYVWASDAPKSSSAAGIAGAEEDNDGNAAASYNPTAYVQYDMAAATYEADNNVYCRPWYANACADIHFNSNAEILYQQHLDYQKAWVDMELRPHQWYNVAAPLYGIVAGDMYLPKADARQATELFTNITYSTTLNDRFQPAVYQRGWDKGSETVYNIAATDNAVPGCPKTESVALASTWSHAYNDVTEQYNPGMGYSVKTDVSRFETDNATFDGLVKFRFPKADTSYNYFADNNETGNAENGGTLNRGKEGRLFEIAADGTTQISVSKATEGNLFLVGNPFMAHLDMAAFLKENEGAIEPKFWILNGDNQIGAVLDHNKDDVMFANETITSGSMTATSQTAGKLPPMQGFFVKAKDKSKTLNLKFTPAMMAVEAYSDDKGLLVKAPAYSGTRSGNDNLISVSTGESTAIIRLSAHAVKGYEASEDVEMIDDSNQRAARRVYTVAGTMAAAINQTPDADGVEVGLMAPADSVTMVTFEGRALEDYMLYDTSTGESVQLYDGFRLEIKGSAGGRFFLTSGLDTSLLDDSSISIIPSGHEVVVKAPASCGALTVRVFDTLGREVAKSEGLTEEARISLGQGVYVVDVAGTEKGRAAEKISIR